MSDLLVDLSPTGRPRPWSKHKLSNNKLISVYEFLRMSDVDRSNLHRRRSDLLTKCGSQLEFEECPHGHIKRLKRAYFCRQRLCSTCSWRRSLFVYHQFLMVAHEVLRLHPDYQFIFITLTIKNCTADRLSDEITHLIDAFDRLRSYKRFDSIKGTFRTNEVTYNPLNEDYHPHIHAIGVVPPSYFKGSVYISQEELIHLWKKALQVDYAPNVDIRKVRKKHSNIPTVEESLIDLDYSLDDSLAGAAAEVAKYSVKVQDIIDPKPKLGDSPEMARARLSMADDISHQAKVIKSLDHSLNRRRMISYSGLFKEAYISLNQSDVEESNLILMPGEENTDCTCKICQSELVQVHYLWDQNLRFHLKQGIKNDEQKALQKAG